MDRRKLIPALLGLGIGVYIVYQLLKEEEKRREEKTPEEIRRECRIRASQVCSQAGGTLKDKCSENEVSIASYECLDTIYQCCLSTAQPTPTPTPTPPEAPQPYERIIGVAGGGGAAVTLTPQPTPTPTPAPQPPPYQPPPELPPEILQPGCPASMPEGPYDQPLPNTIEETINTINPYGRRVTAKIIKKCYCYPLGPSDKPYYCCACPQILCPQGYYPSDVSSGDERSFFVYPGLWCNKL
jgi:hypothetical protein